MEKKRIESLANKILKGEVIKPTKRKNANVFKEEMREARKYAKRIERYKEITGLKRISKESREALFDYTASQVAKSRKITQKQLNKRIANYERKYGEASIEAINRLKYATPKSVAKKIGTYVEVGSKYKGDDIKKGKERGYVKYSKLPSTTFSWYQIPRWVRMWKRTNVTFMYENSEVLFSGASIRFPEDLERMTSGSDWSLWQFVDVIVKEIPHLSAMYHNMEEGHGDEVYLVPAKEWENTESLHPGWRENMLYKPKDWSLVNEEDRR